MGEQIHTNQDGAASIRVVGVNPTLNPDRRAVIERAISKLDGIQFEYGDEGFVAIADPNGDMETALLLVSGQMRELFQAYDAQVAEIAAMRQRVEDAKLIAWAWEEGIVTAVYSVSPLHGARVGWGCWLGTTDIQWGDEHVLTDEARTALTAARALRGEGEGKSHG